jgi:hypothetical protein
LNFGVGDAQIAQQRNRSRIVFQSLPVNQSPFVAGRAVGVNVAARVAQPDSAAVGAHRRHGFLQRDAQNRAPIERGIKRGSHAVQRFQVARAFADILFDRGSRIVQTPRQPEVFPRREHLAQNQNKHERQQRFHGGRIRGGARVEKPR